MRRPIVRVSAYTSVCSVMFNTEVVSLPESEKREALLQFVHSVSNLGAILAFWRVTLKHANKWWAKKNSHIFKVILKFTPTFLKASDHSRSKDGLNTSTLSADDSIDRWQQVCAVLNSVCAIQLVGNCHGAIVESSVLIVLHCHSQPLLSHLISLVLSLIMSSEAHRHSWRLAR